MCPHSWVLCTEITSHCASNIYNTQNLTDMFVTVKTKRSLCFFKNKDSLLLSIFYIGPQFWWERERERERETINCLLCLEVDTIDVAKTHNSIHHIRHVISSPVKIHLHLILNSLKVWSTFTFFATPHPVDLLDRKHCTVFRHLWFFSETCPHFHWNAEQQLKVYPIKKIE